MKERTFLLSKLLRDFFFGWGGGGGGGKFQFIFELLVLASSLQNIDVKGYPSGSLYLDPPTVCPCVKGTMILILSLTCEMDLRAV